MYILLSKIVGYEVTSWTEIRKFCQEIFYYYMRKINTKVRDLARDTWRIFYATIHAYFFLIISSTRRFLFAGSSLADTLSFNKPTITSKILFTFLRKSAGSSVSEIRYSDLLLKKNPSIRDFEISVRNERKYFYDFLFPAEANSSKGWEIMLEQISPVVTIP